jgi:hypothetical protein
MITQEKFDTIISELNSDIICCAAVGSKCQDSILFEPNENGPIIIDQKREIYNIGKFESKTISIDPNLRWGDLRIFDKKGNVLIDLAQYDINVMFLI